jgi:hypothetical protein
VTIAQFVFALNALWFTAAFVQFSVAQSNTAKILVPREARDNPLVPTIKASVAFLGGMNLAVALFCLYLATAPSEFSSGKAQAVLFAFLSAVNFSQFYFNLPILKRGGRVGVAWWPVLSGPMLLIFVIDAALTVIDAIMAVAVY